jgi:hypothetical protein
MTQSQKLIQLLEEQVLPDTQDHLDYLFELVATKKADQEEINELKEIQDMRTEFKTMLDDIKSGDMDQEEIEELVCEIEEMLKANKELGD